VSVFVCVRTPDRVSWFGSEQDYYDGRPTFEMRFDQRQTLWYGQSFHPTTKAMTPSVGEAFRRLGQFPTSDVSDLVTHFVSEPGAPLEPVVREEMPA
jgi:hypothetical protein